jgi:hypothetical protein
MENEKLIKIAAHLPTGKTVPATVEKIEFQTVHPRLGQEEIKPVMYFQGKQKGLILTSTNQDFLRATFGDEITRVGAQFIAPISHSSPCAPSARPLPVREWIPSSLAFQSNKHTK